MIDQLMPKQAFCALIELIANKALSLHQSSLANQEQNLLASVEQKSLTLLINEFEFPLTILADNGKLNIISSKLSTDCVIQTSLKALPKLKQGDQITALIKSGELDIVGDVKIAQQFASVAESLDIDWQQQLALRIGDVPAFKVSKLGKLIANKIKFATEQIQLDSSEYLLHEKQLLVTGSKINKFNQQVAQLEQDVDTLTQDVEELVLKLS